MNARTSKLLRKYATVSKTNYRQQKRWWSALPAPKRHEFRLTAREVILDADPQCD